MILLISICKEKLHYYEFVKPIEDILKKSKINFFTRSYKNLKKEDLINCEKVIICGTSILDNNFIKELDKFSWVSDFEKPILGICAGFQIIGLLWGGERGSFSPRGSSKRYDYKFC
jgi:anthranilate/para-aminobenzoate synthase component II